MTSLRIALAIIALCWIVIFVSTGIQGYKRIKAQRAQQQTDAQSIWLGATSAQAAAESAYNAGKDGAQIAAAAKAAQ